MNQPEQKTDLRIQKTLAALTGALTELMGEKELDSITVKEICDRANTRKATFYNHFTDKNDLLSYIIQRQMLLSEQEGAVYDDPDDRAAYYIEILRYLMNFLDRNEKMMEQIIKSSNPVIEKIYKEEMTPVFYERLKKEKKNGNALVYSPGLLAGVMSEIIIECAQYRFLNKKSVSESDALNQLEVLIRPLFAV